MGADLIVSCGANTPLIRTQYALSPQYVFNTEIVRIAF
nr:MAG TPA: hypothetical protein [Caudoviricetes sp.]